MPERRPLLVPIGASGFRMPRGPPGTAVLEDRAVGPVLDELVRARVLTGTERDTVVVALARLVMFT